MRIVPYWDTARDFARYNRENKNSKTNAIPNTTVMGVAPRKNEENDRFRFKMTLNNEKFG